MVTIGGGELLGAYTLLIPRDASASIPVDINGWKFDLGVRFDNAAPEQGVDVVPDGEGAVLVFRKWDSSLGTALAKPVRLAKLGDGQELALMASNYAIGDTNRLDLQLLLQRMLLWSRSGTRSDVLLAFHVQRVVAQVDLTGPLNGSGNHSNSPEPAAVPQGSEDAPAEIGRYIEATAFSRLEDDVQSEVVLRFDARHSWIHASAQSTIADAGNACAAKVGAFSPLRPFTSRCQAISEGHRADAWRTVHGLATSPGTRREERSSPWPRVCVGGAGPALGLCGHCGTVARRPRWPRDIDRSLAGLPRPSQSDVRGVEA